MLLLAFLVGRYGDFEFAEIRFRLIHADLTSRPRGLCRSVAHQKTVVSSDVIYFLLDLLKAGNDPFQFCVQASMRTDFEGGSVA